MCSINMNSQAIRISRSFDELRPVFQSLKARHVIVYEHVEDEEVSRTHVHALVQNADVTVLAFKRRIEKHLGKVEKSDWSFKETTGNEGKYITYMSKGELQPVYSVGYTNLEIETFRSYWVTPKKEVKESPPSFKHIIAEVISELPISEDDYRSESHVLTVTNLLIKKLNKYHVVTGRFKIRDMLDTIFRTTSPERFSSSIVKLYSERFS